MRMNSPLIRLIDSDHNPEVCPSPRYLGRLDPAKDAVPDRQNPGGSRQQRSLLLLISFIHAVSFFWCVFGDLILAVSGRVPNLGVSLMRTPMRKGRRVCI